MTVVEELTEKVFNLRTALLADALVVEEKKDKMSDIKNGAMDDILNDGSFSNEAKRKAELDRRLKADADFSALEADVKTSVERIKRTDIDLNYAENKLRNARLALKIQHGIRE